MDEHVAPGTEGQVGLEPGQPEAAEEIDKPTEMERWDLLLGVLFWGCGRSRCCRRQ